MAGPDREKGGDLSPDFLSFIAPGSNRPAALGKILENRGIPYQIVSLGSKRHLISRLGPGEPRIILSAHYDRVAGSPGLLDNSLACLELAEFAARLLHGLQFKTCPPEYGKTCPPAGPHAQTAARFSPGSPGAGAGLCAAVEGLFILFTDGEEAPAKEGPLSQGAYTLARALKTALGTGLEGLEGILVFDMTGRGEQLLLSRAPALVLEKHGQAGEQRGQVSRLAARLGGLELLCGRAARGAGIAKPLRLPLPWSDDLGFMLGGLPALNVSLLPRDEALAYGRFCAARPAAQILGAPLRGEAGAAWPLTWDYMHSPADDLPLLDWKAVGLMARFLDSLLPLLPRG